MLRVTIRPAARRDVEGAAEYYAQISEELAIGFVEEFQASLPLLAQNPGIGSRRFAQFSADGSLKVWSLDRFPFGVFFVADGRDLQIVRVIHQRRHLSAGLFGAKPRRQP